MREVLGIAGASGRLEKQDPDAQRLFQEAIMLFRQGKRNEGYARYQELVDKDYASARYRNIKEQLKARK